MHLHRISVGMAGGSLADGGGAQEPAASVQGRLFYNLVGPTESSRRQHHANGVSSLEVDDERPPAWVLERKITGLCAIQNLLHVSRSLPELIGDVRRIGHESARFGHFDMAPDRGDAVAQSK